MECIDVVCGIIIVNTKVLVAQRSAYMSLPLKWEFPGGKMMANETPSACLQRELREELNISVTVKSKFHTNKHRYENFEILLSAYFADIEGGSILTIEHKRISWLSRKELAELDWAAADVPIVERLIQSSHL